MSTEQPKREDTYPMPKHGWTCFHCGETFTTVGSARDHFGGTPDVKPGCLEKVGVGAERGLLMALRRANTQISDFMNEDSDMYRGMLKLQLRHSEELKLAEILGYERGLRDARGQS